MQLPIMDAYAGGETDGGAACMRSFGELLERLGEDINQYSSTEIESVYFQLWKPWYEKGEASREFKASDSLFYGQLLEALKGMRWARTRTVRMKNLRKEIQRAKSRRREYDRPLAELRGLEKEERDERRGNPNGGIPTAFPVKSAPTSIMEVWEQVKDRVEIPDGGRVEVSYGGQKLIVTRRATGELAFTLEREEAFSRMNRNGDIYPQLRGQFDAMSKKAQETGTFLLMGTPKGPQPGFYAMPDPAPRLPGAPERVRPGFFDLLPTFLPVPSLRPTRVEVEVQELTLQLSRAFDAPKVIQQVRGAIRDVVLVFERNTVLQPGAAEQVALECVKRILGAVIQGWEETDALRGARKRRMYAEAYGASPDLAGRLSSPTEQKPAPSSEDLAFQALQARVDDRVAQVNDLVSRGAEEIFESAGLDSVAKVLNDQLEGAKKLTEEMKLEAAGEMMRSSAAERNKILDGIAATTAVPRSLVIPAAVPSPLVMPAESQAEMLIAESFADEQRQQALILRARNTGLVSGRTVIDRFFSREDYPRDAKLPVDTASPVDTPHEEDPVLRRKPSWE